MKKRYTLFFFFAAALIFMATGCNKKASKPKPIKTFISPEIPAGTEKSDGTYNVSIDFFKDGTWVCNIASGKDTFPLLNGTYTGDVTRDTNNENHVTMTIPKNDDTATDKDKKKDATAANLLSWDKDYSETIIIRNGDIDWDNFWLFYKDNEKKGFFDGIKDFFGGIFK